MTRVAPVEGFRAYWERVGGLPGTWSAEDDRVGRFYVPMLERAGSYDRMAGYFSSSALTLAACGLSSFIANGGVMRLIVGAQLDQDDVDAIERGEPLADAVARVLLQSDAMRDPTSVVAEHRRNVLGWLAREGRLDIRVGVPLSPTTRRPLRPAEATKYFHSKYGVFADCGDMPDRVAFVGSDNETWQGWVGNHETFSVFPTWLEQVWAYNGVGLVDKFEAHWRDRPDEGWAVLPLHDAVRGELLKWARNDTAPTEVDPEADSRTPPMAPLPAPPVAVDVRLVDLAEAPRRDGGTFVGLATAGVEPLPHQTRIVKRVVETWPRGYLLADEVGLGKTIEAGFAMRELLLSGRAERFLLLVPAAVLRQWQEELSEKLGLRVNRFDGGEFVDPDNRPVAHTGTPWAAFPIVLASSHLARRRDRLREVLAAGPWDVVLVDEAHHARRGGGKADGQPNRLLRLLQAMRDEGAFRALILASATPMQMHPHEAWDLVELLGLPGRWAKSSSEFVRFFGELQQDFERRQWKFVSGMAHDALADPAARTDPVLDARIDGELGLADAHWVRQVGDQGLSQAQAKSLPTELRPWVDAWLRTNNPMRERVFRNTRTTLRAYRDAGLLPPGTVIPERHVDDRFVEMRPDDERQLYERIRSYIRRSYNRYMADNQKALGFIMTVYRRRLTSSFRAITRSLERRREALQHKRTAAELLDDDDQYANPTLPIDLYDLPHTPLYELEQEIWELGEFIKLLHELPPAESKMGILHDLVHDAFAAGHGTVLVFTQYADTMDYIVEQLALTYGAQVMSFSGGRGRRRDPLTGEWVEVPKAETKQLFAAGTDVKILVGTDALSEGLNLQTCGRLVNYDMPWNFTRVEQRIGRLDRIGGKPLIEVTNLFYKGTIEEQIYHGIAAGYDGFSWVVGTAQPVLAAAEDAIIAHEMGPDDADSAQPAHHPLPIAKPAEVIVEELLQELHQAQARAVSVSTFDENDPDPNAGNVQPAVTLHDIQETLLAVPATRDQLREHPAIPGAWIVTDADGEDVAVTFERAVLQEHSPDVRLLTYGDPLFELVLKRGGV